jgi:hypothetical protein
MSNRFFYGVMAIGLTALAGCAESPPLNAVVTGSKIEMPLAGPSDELVAYVMEIDNKLLPDGPSGWNHRFVLPPGTHDIMFGIAHGGVAKGPFHSATVNFRTGAFYEVRATPPVRAADDLYCAHAWIEENGTPVTDKANMSLVYKSYGYMPLGNGSVVPLTAAGRKAPFGCEFGF